MIAESAVEAYRQVNSEPPEPEEKKKRESLIARLRAWRDRRFWSKVQLEYLRVLVSEDARWLAQDPTASALTQRYEAMLREDWYTLITQPISSLRRQLGLDPHTCAASSKENMLAEFEAWWGKHGQLGRAGGGEYEKTFAWNAWVAARSAQP